MIWWFIHGSLNVPIEHHPTIRYMVYNGYYKVMSNIPKMGHLPTPVISRKWNMLLFLFSDKKLSMNQATRANQSLLRRINYTNNKVDLCHLKISEVILQSHQIIHLYCSTNQNIFHRGPWLCPKQGRKETHIWRFKTQYLQMIQPQLRDPSGTSMSGMFKS
jgi:hypothetical protein